MVFMGQGFKKSKKSKSKKPYQIVGKNTFRNNKKTFHSQILLASNFREKKKKFIF